MSSEYPAYLTQEKIYTPTNPEVHPHRSHQLELQPEAVVPQELIHEAQQAALPSTERPLNKTEMCEELCLTGQALDACREQKLLEGGNL